MRAMKYILLSVLMLTLACSASQARQLGPYEWSTGFDARDHPRHEETGKASRKVSSSLKLELHPRAFFKVTNDNFVSKAKSDGGRFTWVGNTWLTFGVDAVSEDSTGVKNHPSLGFTYVVKLPTGSQAKTLGTGRVDHNFTVSIGKSVGNAHIIGGNVKRRTSLGVDLGVYSAGNKGQSGFTTVGEVTLGFTHVLGDLSLSKYKYHSEVYMSSPAKDTLSEVYAKNDLTTKLSSHFRMRLGVRTGLTPNSARFGVYGSLVYSGNFRSQKSGQ